MFVNGCSNLDLRIWMDLNHLSPSVLPALPMVLQPQRHFGFPTGQRSSHRATSGQRVQQFVVGSVQDVIGQPTHAAPRFFCSINHHCMSAIASATFKPGSRFVE